MSFSQLWKMQSQQQGIAVKIMSLNYLQQSLCLALGDLSWQVLSIAPSHVFGCEPRVFLVTFQVGVWSSACRMHQREQELCCSREALHHLASGSGIVLTRSLISLVVNAETDSSKERRRVYTGSLSLANFFEFWITTLLNILRPGKLLFVKLLEEMGAGTERNNGN